KIGAYLSFVRLTLISSSSNFINTVSWRSIADGLPYHSSMTSVIPVISDISASVPMYGPSSPLYKAYSGGFDSIGFNNIPDISLLTRFLSNTDFIPTTSAKSFIYPVRSYSPYIYNSYFFLGLPLLIPSTLQFDQFIYKKLRFIQIFDWRAFILKSSNIFQCTDSVKTTSFFRTELSFRKSNHINTALVVVCREINVVYHHSHAPSHSVLIVCA